MHRSSTCHHGGTGTIPTLCSYANIYASDALLSIYMNIYVICNMNMNIHDASSIGMPYLHCGAGVGKNILVLLPVPVY